MPGAMAEEVRPGYVLEHPNRDKASSKITKVIITAILLASVGLMLVVTLGGWQALAGMKPVLIGYEVVYLLMAYYCMRWNRGVLPLAAALGIILLIFAAISGPQWYDRDKTGFTDPNLSSSFLGLVTFVIVPVQFLLIAFSMSGFSQNWQTEYERKIDEDDDGRAGRRQPEPQSA